MDITKAFLDGKKDCREYNEAYQIVKRNSSGKIWLIGSFVFRTIAHQMYGAEKPEDVDLDFIVERPAENFNLPPGWKAKKNRFGNPKFVNGRTQIDYVPLKNIYSILKRGLAPTIENFLTGVPLNVQSLAFDTQEEKIVGERGIDSLKRKVVEVVDLDLARYAAQKKGITLEEMIRRKAEELGFTPVFP